MSKKYRIVLFGVSKYPLYFTNLSAFDVGSVLAGKLPQMNEDSVIAIHCDVVPDDEDPADA